MSESPPSVVLLSEDPPGGEDESRLSREAALDVHFIGVVSALSGGLPPNRHSKALRIRLSFPAALPTDPNSQWLGDDPVAHE